MSSSAKRLTFREKAREQCHQRTLRDAFMEEGCPVPDDQLKLKFARVKRIDRSVAEQIILKYEWLGTLPSGCTHYYGLFFGPYCAGVTCVSIGSGGANLNAFKEWGLRSQFELAYLARGANVHWSPSGANSKLVSWTCRLLAKQTGARIVIAYSDTDAGEIGTIYQACNWTCVGRGSATRQWINPAGRIYDQKHPANLKSRHGGTRAYWVQRLKREGWREQESNPKYRYVQVLDKSDKALVQLVRSKQCDYPKRAPISS